MNREDFTEWRVRITTDPQYRAVDGEKGLPFEWKGETIVLNMAGWQELKAWRKAFVAWRKENGRTRRN